jgi:hypothetical protein
VRAGAGSGAVASRACGACCGLALRRRRLPMRWQCAYTADPPPACHAHAPVAIQGRLIHACARWRFNSQPCPSMHIPSNDALHFPALFLRWLTAPPFSGWAAAAAAGAALLLVRHRVAVARARPLRRVRRHCCARRSMAGGRSARARKTHHNGDEGAGASAAASQQQQQAQPRGGVSGRATAAKVRASRHGRHTRTCAHVRAHTTPNLP